MKNKFSETRLAIVLSHPTQYFSPWFKHIAENSHFQIKVFYLWDFGVENRLDRNFGRALKWDIPLLDGYEYEFVPNRSRDPGTHHFFGLNNPGLVHAITAWKPDAILLYGYNYLSHLKIIFSYALRQVPLLFRGDSHDISRSNDWKSGLKRLLRLLLFKRFSAFLSVGKANTVYLRNSGVAEKHIFFAPHSVDNGRFQASMRQAKQEAGVWRDELGIAANARVILFVGKFDEIKRPFDLVCAFKSAREQLQATGICQPAALVMVGSGELEADLRASVKDDPGLNIFFTGFQNQSQMAKVYALGDFLVLPSSSETWGLVVNEAMNFGLPVAVSSHVGCAPDLVENDNTGWVYSAGDINGLATILVRMMSMKDAELAAMEKTAKLRIESYSYDIATKALNDTLEFLMMQRAKG